MHTVTISREGLLRFGFSELERPSWRLKNATTLYEVQPIQPRLYSLKLPKNNIRPYSLKSGWQENVNSDMGAANAPLSIRGHATLTALSALFTFRETRHHWRNLLNMEKNGMPKSCIVLRNKIGFNPHVRWGLLFWVRLVL